MSIKVQILLNFRENVSCKSTGYHTCWSVKTPWVDAYQDSTTVSCKWINDIFRKLSYLWKNLHIPDDDVFRQLPCKWLLPQYSYQHVKLINILHLINNSKMTVALFRRWCRSWEINYCKTFNVSVPFISRISRAKQNREIKGHEYQLQAKIGRNYDSISNCMVLICQNKGAKIILHAKSPTFRAAKLKGFTVCHFAAITSWKMPYLNTRRLGGSDDWAANLGLVLMSNERQFHLLPMSTGAAPWFWKWGDKFCERSEQKIFLTPTFWPVCWTKYCLAESA